MSSYREKRPEKPSALRLALLLGLGYVAGTALKAAGSFVYRKATGAGGSSSSSNNKKEEKKEVEGEAKKAGVPKLQRNKSMLLKRVVSGDAANFAEQEREAFIANKECFAGCTRRHVVFAEQVTDDLHITEFASVARVKGAPILEGFPGDSVASPLVAAFLVKALNLPLVAELDSQHFPPVGVISNFAMYPGCRVYGDERLVVFLSEFTLDESAGTLAKDLAHALMTFASRHESKGVLSLEGIEDKEAVAMLKDPESQEEVLAMIAKSLGTDESKAGGGDDEEEEEEDGEGDGEGQTGGALTAGALTGLVKRSKKDERYPKRGEVAFSTNDASLAKRMSDLGHHPLNEGMVSGVTGALVARACSSHVGVMVLFSPHLSALPDAVVAVPILRAIAKLLDLEVDMAELEEEVHEIEGTLRKAIEGLGGGVKRQNSVPPQGMYV